MVKIVTPAAQLVFVAVGASVGLWLKAAPAPVDSATGHGEVTVDDSNAKQKIDDKHKKSAKGKPSQKQKKSGSHGGGHSDKSKSSHDNGDAASDDTYGFVKFSRQFIVPVIGAAGVNSLVVLDINIEVPPSVTESVYLLEPKLRDVLLSVLLQRSNDGAFEQNILEKSNLEGLRSDLLAAAKGVIGDDAKDILILSIARQRI